MADYIAPPTQRGYWRDSTSLILTAQCLSAPAETDYQVLLVQRTGASKFMPKAAVFPGGVVNEEDFSDDWVRLFWDLSGRSPAEIGAELRTPGPRSPIMSKGRGSGLVPPEVGLRICAIRETFEESGVLLLTRRPPGRRVNSSIAMTHTIDDLPEETLRADQMAVARDASHFLNVCRRYDAVPDVWGLSEWANWLTPADSSRQLTEPPKKAYRFDTLFYICALDHIPAARKDNTEVKALKWLSPYSLYTDTKLQKHLRGPQRYLLSQLANYRRHNQLVDFYRQRATLGMERWLPVVVFCKDGVLVILPGDDLYPSHPDKEGRQPVRTIEKTMAELEEQSVSRHRFVQGSGGLTYSMTHIDRGYGFPAPLKVVTDPNNRL